MSVRHLSFLLLMNYCIFFFNNETWQIFGNFIYVLTQVIVYL